MLSTSSFEKHLVIHAVSDRGQTADRISRCIVIVQIFRDEKFIRRSADDAAIRGLSASARSADYRTISLLIALATI
jgi:hypothetical protein